jgi:hypothetical protein
LEVLVCGFVGPVVRGICGDLGWCTDAEVEVSMFDVSGEQFGFAELEELLKGSHGL